VHYSLQRDHVHLLVEAAGKRALADGMKSISPRLARCVHRVFRRRGPVLFGRYYIKLLRTPLEVHRALRYVLLNARRHWKKRRGVAPPVVRLDEASSSRWFDGWTRLFQSLPPPAEKETADPRTWLLSEGWRRHGRIDPAAVPG
jgi:hypothetical protein